MISFSDLTLLNSQLQLYFESVTGYSFVIFQVHNEFMVLGRLINHQIILLTDEEELIASSFGLNLNYSTLFARKYPDIFIFNNNNIIEFEHNDIIIPL